MLRKVITNLKYWGNCELIINKTLHLLSDLSVGYGTVRKLVKLEEVIIANVVSTIIVVKCHRY